MICYIRVPFYRLRTGLLKLSELYPNSRKRLTGLKVGPAWTTELLPLRIYLSHSEQYLCLDFTVDFSSKSKLCTVNVFLISQFILQCHKWMFWNSNKFSVTGQHSDLGTQTVGVGPHINTVLISASAWRRGVHCIVLPKLKAWEAWCVVRLEIKHGLDFYHRARIELRSQKGRYTLSNWRTTNCQVKLTCQVTSHLSGKALHPALVILRFYCSLSHSNCTATIRRFIYFFLEIF